MKNKICIKCKNRLYYYGSWYPRNIRIINLYLHIYIIFPLVAFFNLKKKELILIRLIWILDIPFYFCNLIELYYIKQFNNKDNDYSIFLTIPQGGFYYLEMCADYLKSCLRRSVARAPGSRGNFRDPRGIAPSAGIPRQARARDSRRSAHDVDNAPASRPLWRPAAREIWIRMTCDAISRNGKNYDVEIELPIFRKKKLQYLFCCLSSFSLPLVLKVCPCFPSPTCLASSFFSPSVLTITSPTKGISGGARASALAHASQYIGMFTLLKTRHSFSIVS